MDEIEINIPIHSSVHAAELIHKVILEEGFDIVDVIKELKAVHKSHILAQMECVRSDQEELRIEFMRLDRLLAELDKA